MGLLEKETEEERGKRDRREESETNLLYYLIV